MNLKAISPKDLLIYLCLRRYRNKITGEASVPISKIVMQTGAAPVTVLSSLERLVKQGHITSEKKGRANVYSFLTQIEAQSFDFLDKPLTHNEKVEVASKTAFIKNVKDKAGNDSKLYGYVQELEKHIASLNKHVRHLTQELDKTRRTVSMLTGVPYTPLPELGTHETE